jgi:hypothetical protein
MSALFALNPNAVMGVAKSIVQLSSPKAATCWIYLRRFLDQMDVRTRDAQHE